eukprot:g6779.t1
MGRSGWSSTASYASIAMKTNIDLYIRQSVIRCAKEYVKVLQKGIDQKELFKLLNRPWPSQLPIGIKDEVVNAIKEVRRVIGMEDDSYLPKYANGVTVDLLDLHLYFSRIGILKRPLMPVAPLNRKYATIDDRIAKSMFSIKKKHLNDKNHDYPYLHSLGFSPQAFEDAQNYKRKMLRKYQGSKSGKVKKKWKAKGRINLPKNGVIKSILTDGVGLSLRLASPLKMEYIHEPVDKSIKRKKDKNEQTKLVEESRHEDRLRRPVFVGIDTGRSKLYCGSISKGGEAKPVVQVYTRKKYYHDIGHKRRMKEEEQKLEQNVQLKLAREALGVVGQDNNILSFIQAQNLHRQVLVAKHINSKFYSFRKMRAFRLRKAALSKASNALINSAIEPNRRLVLGIGNANFSSNGRGSKSVPTTSLMKAIQEAKRTKELELNKGANWNPITILNINDSDCILKWCRTRQNPFCPLCFASFNSILLPDGTEQEILSGDAERTEEPDFTGLDHSFFLGDVLRLLQRTQHLLKDSLFHRNRHRQLMEITRILESHKINLEARGELNAAGLLQELHSMDHTVTELEGNFHRVENSSPPRIYGADDAHLVSSDDESEFWDQHFCDDEAAFRRNRNGNSLVRPSKPFENKPARMKKQNTQSRTRKKNTLIVR